MTARHVEVASSGVPYHLVDNDTTSDTIYDDNDVSTDVQKSSHITFDKCVYDAYKITVPLIFSIVVVLGILGNVLVIYVILARPKLRTVTNLLLANLAFADLSFLVVCGTFTAAHYALEAWPLSDILCRVIQFLLFTTCYVTVYTLIAISVVRFIIVVYSAQHRLVRSKRNIVYLIIALWITFLIAKIPILIVHGVSFDPATNRTECIISGRAEGQQLFASFFVFAYALPLVIIGAFYLAIVAHVKRKGSACNHNRACVKQRMGHVTKVTLLVVTVFAICWLPLHIHLLVGYYGHLPHNSVYGTLLIVWHCLVFANSILNPVIYNFFSKDFRNGFKETLKLTRHRSVQTTTL